MLITLVAGLVAALPSDVSTATALVDVTVPNPDNANTLAPPPPTDDSMWVKIDSVQSGSSYQGIFVSGDTTYCSSQSGNIDVRSRIDGSLIRTFNAQSGSTVLAICRFGDSLCISRMSSPERCEVYTLGGSYVRTFYPSGSQQVRGLDWDGTRFWASSYLSSALTIYTMDRSGTVLKTLTRSGGNQVTISIGRDLTLDRMYSNRLWSIPNTSSPYKVMYVAFDTTANTYTVLDTFQTIIPGYLSGIDFYIEPSIGGVLYCKAFSQAYIHRVKVHNPLGPPGDVGVTRILAPTGSVDSGAAVTPACSVYNYGNATEASYDVSMKVGSYSGTATVTNHASHTYVYTTFADWTPTTRGTSSVACSTRLYGDTNTGNDKQTDSVTVNVRDMSVSHLLAPVGAYDSGMVVTPSCSVSNYGTAAAQCSVRMKVATYNQAIFVDQAAGTRVHYTFPDWNVGARGTYTATCSTEYATDMKGSNDKVSRTVTVNVPDVGVSVLLAPGGTIPKDTVVTPACSVYNYGSTTPLNYTVRMRIGTVYEKTLIVAGHLPGNRRYCTFPPWTAVEGTWTVTCSTELTGDVRPENNAKTGQVIVKSGQPPPGGGWTLKMPMPAGAKPAKDGAWLDYDAGTERIYASRGNKQPDFFAYDPEGDSWGARAPWQPGTEAKLPQKSSAGCADGNDVVWATKGNSTLGFWKYEAAANAWTQKKDVPLGTTNKKLKGGSGITFAYKGGVGSPFLLKGYKNEFYRYDVPGDSWQTLTPAPVGAKEKWDKGSWLAYDDANNKVYAFKAKYMEFYSYNPNNDSWSAALAPMPAGSSGKKAKDGSCGTFYDDCVYALKGGNTQEFWKYTIATNAWTVLETIPKGLEKKKVKAGGSITTAGDALYALKANKSNQLWQYGFPAFVFEPPRHDGVLAAGSPNVEVRMSIGPNPLSGGPATVRLEGPVRGPVRLEVIDVTGRTLYSSSELRPSSFRLDLRYLANGVYLVKFSSEGFANSQKLVVQR